MRSLWLWEDVEDTDLERRVLAYERILQALIAHMAEAEPSFVARLSAIFRDPFRASRGEHDPVNTHAYADRFVEAVVRLMEHRAARDAVREPTPRDPRDNVGEDKDVVAVLEGPAATLLQISHCADIWELTKDGSFYGHYAADQSAFDAAEAAAFAIVAAGGTADLLWNDEQPQWSEERDVSPFDVVQTMEFRAGSTRITREYRTRN